ncbi:MAG: hypothetical protein ACTILG_10855, partial [Sphingobacterium sp.]
LNVDGGIWMKLLMRMGAVKDASDSLARHIKREINPRLFENALEKIISEQANLKIVFANDIIAIDKKRKHWSITLEDGHKYTVDCVIDASVNQKLGRFSAADTQANRGPSMLKLDEMSSAEIRTLLVTGEIDRKLFGVQFSNLIRGENDGFFKLSAFVKGLDTSAGTAPFRSAFGQALGATAAYLSYFATASAAIDVRKLQTELMSDGARILPFSDLAIDDPNFDAIQRVGLAAIFNFKSPRAGFILDKDRYISYAELEPVFNRLYSRSQLWPVEDKTRDLTLSTALSLIKFVALRGDEIEKEVKRDWSTLLHFAGSYQEDKPIGRYEFMVLLDRYASPFSKKVDRQGYFIF